MQFQILFYLLPLLCGFTILIKYRPDLDEANKILRILDKKKFGIAFPIRKDYKGRVFVSIPSNFSISDYPEEVIKFIRRFYATLRDN